MSSTILHSSDEGSKIPLAKKFTYFIFEPWIKKESRTKMDMRFCFGWKWGCVCFHEFHHIIVSITISLFLGIWFVPAQPIEKTAGRADLRKSVFFYQSDRSATYQIEQAAGTIFLTGKVSQN